MLKTRSAALPLLFAGLLLAAGTALLLIVPAMACRPCQGAGLILVYRGDPAPPTFDIRSCRLCGESGRVRLGTWLRSDPASTSHLGALRGQSRPAPP